MLRGAVTLVVVMACLVVVMASGNVATEDETWMVNDTVTDTLTETMTKMTTGTETETPTQGAPVGRVLFLYPIATKSHSHFYMGIVNALVDAGSHVTVVSPYKSSRPREGVREVLVEGDGAHHFRNIFEGHRLSGSLALAAEAPVTCSNALAREEVQRLLKEDFDVVILSVTFSQCFLSFVYQLNVPYIWACPMGMLGPTALAMGSPQFPSFISTKLFPYKQPLNFLQRAVSTFIDVIVYVAHERITLPSIEHECRKRSLCPPEMPSFNEMMGNATMILLNSVKLLQTPVRPSVPAEIHCGGIHCRPANPLSQDLESWIQGAGNAGFIFFSLGTIVQSSSLPEEYRTILVEVFASLDQRVLWKWDEETMKDLPSNVRLAKWLPQQDILGDPRLHLFITHGGLHSVLEATYHGVPLLGLPVFLDQYTNMGEVEAQGWGRYLHWDQLTPELFKNTILEVMQDQNMWETARQRSAIMKDQPMEPGKEAAYWIQYLIRHNGARHMRCPAVTMPWFRLYNVDVWLTAVVVAALLLFVFVKLLVAFISCLCCPKVSKQKRE